MDFYGYGIISINKQGEFNKGGICMRICPKCKESVGESLQECPLCNYHFTDEDNERFRKEKEEIEHGEAKQMELLRASRAKKRVIYAVL
ncbi:MAG: hypothetical protein K6G75_06560, partial [Lachnospiraceae bacterium]|nr:hypothetical protein [Lachnospiraceae bacterium]